MSVFPLFRKSQPKTVTELTPTFFPLAYIQSFISRYDNVSDNNLLKMYLKTPELQAIINYRAKVFADMNIIAMKDEKEMDIPFLSVMKKPNPLQGFREFARQYSIGRDIYGNGYINTVYGVDRKSTKMLFNMPALDADIRLVGGNINPFQQLSVNDIIKDYVFRYNGKELIYLPDEIIHFNDNQIKYENNKWLKGESKLSAISQVCENIITSYEVRGLLIGNSPLGMITDNTKDPVGQTPMMPHDKEEIQKELKKYGISRDKYQYIVTKAALRFESMAVNIGNLKLFEEITEDQSAIADAFAFPVELMQNNVTYENKKEAKKQLYQDSIIPEANEWLQGLSNAIGLNEQGITLIADYSHIPVLQEDMAERTRMWTLAVNALNKAYQDQAITIEEYRENLIKIKIL